jgi:excisionase family DNA binding protein
VAAHFQIYPDSLARGRFAVPRSAQSIEPLRLSLGPASRLLGVDPDTLRRWSDDGRVEAFTTPGGHRRFDRRELERLLQARRPTALRPLASLGGTPDRLSRAYRRSYADQAEQSARSAVPPAQYEAFRTHGRELVAALVAFLDASGPAERRSAEASAQQLTDDLANRLAAAGLSLTESVGLFVAARKPFLSELGVIVRRRALEPDRTSALFEDASSLLDRLLVRLIAAHQEAIGRR